MLGVWLPAPADAASAACSGRALAVGRWRGERFGRYRCLTLRYSLLLSVWVDPSAEHNELFTLKQKPTVGSYILITRSTAKNTVFYSYLACFVNTVILNMYIFMSYTGLSRRYAVFLFMRLRPRNTRIPIQHFRIWQCSSVVEPI